MSKLTKLLIGAGLGVFCLCGLLIAVGGYYMLSYQKGSALFSEGRDAMDERDYATAIVKFGAALKRHLPQQYRAYAFSDLAVSEEFEGLCERAINDYTESLRLDPAYAFAYSCRGRLYRESGETDKALTDFSEAIRLDPNAHQAFYGRGLIDMERKDFDQAIEDLSESVRTDPSAAYAYANRGLAYAYRKEFDRALANYDAALQLRPRDARTLVDRAYVRMETQEQTRAIEDLTAAIRIDPKLEAAYRVRASAYTRTGDYGKAVADFQRALELNATDSTVLNDLAWLKATCPQAEIRDAKQAITDSTAACKMSNWQNASLIDTLAAAYAEAGDFDSALNYQDQAIRSMKGNEERLSEMEERKKLYESHRPYRQPKPN